MVRRLVIVLAIAAALLPTAAKADDSWLPPGDFVYQGYVLPPGSDQLPPYLGWFTPTPHHQWHLVTVGNDVAVRSLMSVLYIAPPPELPHPERPGIEGMLIQGDDAHVYGYEWLPRYARHDWMDYVPWCFIRSGALGQRLYGDPNVAAFGWLPCGDLGTS